MIPRKYIEERIMSRYIECKLTGKEYTNIDINLKLYYEFLTTEYTKNIMRQELPQDEKENRAPKKSVALKNVSLCFIV